MKTELELDHVGWGWKAASLDDDLNVILRTGRTEHEMYASLRGLLYLYYYASQGLECDLPIGTGQSIHIEEVDGDSDIWLRKPPLKIRTTRMNLTEELETVLAAVFLEKGRVSDSERRAEQLEYLNEWLADHDAELDVQQLYQRLS